MDKYIHYRNYVSVKRYILLVGVSITVVIPSCTNSTSSMTSYSSSNNFYQPHPPTQRNSFANYSEARDGGGSGYSVPMTGTTYGSSGDYGASAIPVPIIYKYGIHPTMQKQSNGWGWPGGNDDDEDGEFPTELIGLLGLKGLKGLKGLVGLLGLLKGLLALKKLLLLPLLLILLPLLIPLFLLKLLLILLIPVPVISTTAGRRNLENDAYLDMVQNNLKEKHYSVMAKLPQDIGQILEKIKTSNAKNISWGELMSGTYGHGITVKENTKLKNNL